MGAGAERTWLALDVETASRSLDSLCAVGWARYRGGRLLEAEARLVRPPRRRFEFTSVHGLRWEDVRDAPPFEALWEAELGERVAGAALLVAHHAAFDRAVLRACLRAAGRALPAVPWLCTLELCRRLWRLPSCALPAACEALGIPLDRHHDPRDDALAAARLALRAAEREGVGSVVALARRNERSGEGGLR